MRAIHDYVITTDHRYNNTVDVEGKELVVNTEITERDAEFVHREATVLATPSARKVAIQECDKVIVHHNVFRRWYDVRGNERNGGSYINENMYKVAEDQVFAYNRGDGWKATLGYCFVEPIEDTSEFREERYQKHIGILTYTDEYLDKLGIKPGTIIGFTPESEYEFTIDDKLLYRIYSTNITIDYGLQKGKTKDNNVKQVSTETA